jgi:hypothetical protein
MPLDAATATREGGFMKLYNVALILPLALVALLGAGCSGVTLNLPNGSSVVLPGVDTVTVELFNDTDFEVEPRIRFDSSSNWLASLFPSEELATVFSDAAGQFASGEDVPIGQADSTRVLQRESDYDCGDTVQFHFIGAESSFGVIVSVNDVVVD